jgi:molybdopterin-guanine dinucleotide biosynthesis protein A
MIAARPQRDTITGVVLAGGLGRRMGGEDGSLDKGLRTLRGRPMAAHVLERLAPQVGVLAINANRHLDAWRAFGVPVWPDLVEGYAGPLAGLHAAMTHGSSPWLVTAPCDSPFLPADLVERLARAVVQADAQIAVARTGGQVHPVFALVERSLCAHLEAFLASGRRRIDAWYAPLRVVEVDFEDEAAFRNINTADDLARWEHEPDPGTPAGSDPEAAPP